MMSSQLSLALHVNYGVAHENSQVKKAQNISQGSVATHLRCDGICNGDFVTVILLSLTVKKT